MVQHHVTVSPTRGAQFGVEVWEDEGIVTLGRSASHLTRGITFGFNRSCYEAIMNHRSRASFFTAAHQELVAMKENKEFQKFPCQANPTRSGQCIVFN